MIHAIKIQLAVVLLGAEGGVRKPPRDTAFRRWAQMIQRHPWIASSSALALLVVFIIPVTAMRLDNSDASNDPSSYSSRQAYDMLSSGFGPGIL